MICDYLSFEAGRSLENNIEDVRRYIAGIRDGDEMCVDAKQRDASDKTVIMALEAWRRKPGPPKKAAGEKLYDDLSKWQATLTLLKQSGFEVQITPQALRKAWDRTREHTRK